MKKAFIQPEILIQVICCEDVMGDLGPDGDIGGNSGGLEGWE